MPTEDDLRRASTDALLERHVGEPLRQITGEVMTCEDATGMLREQAIRSDAVGVAVDLLGDCSGTAAGIAARLIELAEPIADWIRDGTTPDGQYAIYDEAYGSADG